MLEPITNGAVSGSETIDCPSSLFGGAVVSPREGEVCSVVIRATNSSGPIVWEISTSQALCISAPYRATPRIHYAIVGGSAQLYQWIT